MDTLQKETHSTQEEITLVDNLEWVSKHFKLISRVTLIGITISFLLAFFAAPEYTSKAKAIKEPLPKSSPGLGGGLNALRSLGLSLGEESFGLSTQHYPEILRSREVGLEVVRAEYYFSDLDATMTMTEYLNLNPPFLKRLGKSIRKYTIDLPKTLRKAMASGRESSQDTTDIFYRFPTFAEEEAIVAIASMMTVSVDRTTDVMHVKVVTHDSRLSYEMLTNYLNTLRRRVNQIESRQAAGKLKFIRERFAVAKVELARLEEAMSRFVDANQHIATAKLQLQVDRFDRQISFQSNLYTELQTQLVQAEISLQRSSSVLTLLEMPRPPVKASGPKRKIMVLMGLFMGMAFGFSLAFVKDILYPDDLEARARITIALSGLTIMQWRKKRPSSYEPL